jgi:hypothetical protein
MGPDFDKERVASGSGDVGEVRVTGGCEDDDERGGRGGGVDVGTPCWWIWMRRWAMRAFWAVLFGMSCTEALVVSWPVTVFCSCCCRNLANTGGAFGLCGGTKPPGVEEVEAEDEVEEVEVDGDVEGDEVVTEGGAKNCRRSCWS